MSNEFDNNECNSYFFYKKLGGSFEKVMNISHGNDHSIVVTKI